MAMAVVRVLGLGSSSARVNEVAKLCRAVVRMTKGGGAPKVLLLASSESSRSDFRRAADAEDKSCMRWSFGERDTARCCIKDGLFVTVCDGLDQAFKGIWWMPWH